MSVNKVNSKPATSPPGEKADSSYHEWEQLNAAVAPLREVEKAIRTNGWSHLTHQKKLCEFYRTWYMVENPQGLGTDGHESSLMLLLVDDVSRGVKMACASAIIGTITAMWWDRAPKAPWRKKLFILADAIRRLTSWVDEMAPPKQETVST